MQVSQCRWDGKKRARKPQAAGIQISATLYHQIMRLGGKFDTRIEWFLKCVCGVDGKG